VQYLISIGSVSWLVPFVSSQEQCCNEIGINYFEIENINKFNYGGLTENVLTLTEHIKLINWLNRNYFDYNNLIGLDLAYSAEGLCIYKNIKNGL
jgi:hypothetical protein